MDRRTALQPLFKPCYVIPLTKFKSASFKSGKFPIAMGTMEMAAFFVGRSDKGINHMVSQIPQRIFQFQIQHFADSTTAAVPSQIDGKIGIPLVGGTLKGTASVGITQHFALFFPD